MYPNPFKFIVFTEEFRIFKAGNAHLKITIMEYLGYILLAIAAVAWFVVVVIGLVAAFPLGLIGFVALGGIGLLLAKVAKDRLENEEDDYYSKNVEK